jgi:hypothetical protein
VTTTPLSTDLTAQATMGASGDWAHWGYMSATDFDHRASGGGIPNFAPLGGASPLQFTTFSNNFSWSDGTPHASANATTTGVYMVGKGSGFAFDFPADTTVRVLHVYVGNYTSTARFIAHLADGSAPDYTADIVDAGAGTYRVFTVKYRASGSSTLHVSWQAIDGAGNLALEAATLVP